MFSFPPPNIYQPRLQTSEPALRDYGFLDLYINNELHSVYFDKRYALRVLAKIVSK